MNTTTEPRNNAVNNMNNFQFESQSIDGNVEDDNSVTTVDLLSLDDDLDDESVESWNSDSDMFSYASSSGLSQQSMGHPKEDSGRLSGLSGFLPSFPKVPLSVGIISSFFPSNKAEAENRKFYPRDNPTKFQIINYDNSDEFSSATDSLIEGTNGMALEPSDSTVPHAEDTSLSSFRTSEISEPTMTMETKRGNILFTDTIKDYTASSQPSDAYLLDDVTDVEESTPCVMKFATECLQRSRERRCSVDFYGLSSRPSHKSLNRSSMNRSSIEAQKPSSYAPHSEPNCSSFSSVAIQKPLISSSNSVEPKECATIPNTAELNQSSNASILSFMSSSTALSTSDDISQSSLCLKVQQMRTKLKTIEINHCRQKCIKSLRRSMVLYMQINAINNEVDNDDDESTICTIGSCYNATESQTFPRKAKVSRTNLIFQIVKDVMCFNLIFAMVWMLFLLYKNLFVDLFRGGSLVESMVGGSI